MKNPNGPYPGRQLFLGLTAKGRPALAYLVTGRSSQSRERKATETENGLIMGPIGNEPYDPLRHYTAIKTDGETGLATVTNGIQTEAVYEMYRLLYNTGSAPGPEYLQKIMTGAKYEPDSLHTPRIAGVIAFPAGESTPACILSIVTDNPPARVYPVHPEPGMLTGISTYSGNLENPEAFDISGELPVIECAGETPGKIAEHIYGISAATNQGDDIRVCAVGGALSADNRTWKLSVINRHK